MHTTGVHRACGAVEIQPAVSTDTLSDIPHLSYIPFNMLLLYLSPFLLLVSVFCNAIAAYKTKVPGPWYAHLTDLVLKYYEFTRRRRLWVHGLHQRYGPVVRLSPEEVSFANLHGLKEIYQSGGSGYDKTEFFSLLKQYGHRSVLEMQVPTGILMDLRSMFTLLNKPEVGFIVNGLSQGD